MLNNHRDMIVSYRQVDIPLPSMRASPLTAVHFLCTNCFTILARDLLRHSFHVNQAYDLVDIQEEYADKEAVSEVVVGNVGVWATVGKFRAALPLFVLVCSRVILDGHRGKMSQLLPILFCAFNTSLISQDSAVPS